MYALRQLRKVTSKSATRALDVLALFGDEQVRLRAKQVAIALDLKPSSVDLLLKTMVFSGYLIFDPISKEYEPSPKLVKFASFLENKLYWSSERISGVLSELRDRTGALASISLRNGDFMCVVDAQKAEDVDYGAAFTLGYPLDGISGQTLLSVYEEEDVRRILDHAERYRHLRRDWPSRLLPAIRETTARGFAFGETYSPLYWSASAPVFLPSGGVNRIAVISASGAKDYIQPRREAIISETRRLAGELTGA